MGLLRKNTASTGMGGRAAPMPCPEELAPYPALWEFIAMGTWEDDGSPRALGTVLLFADDSGVKVMLNDKDGSRVAFSVVDPEKGLFQHVEAMLLSTSTDWRATRRLGTPDRKKGG